MTFTAWLSLFLVCCLGAMSPGPSLAVVLKQTVNNSRQHGLLTSWTHAAGVGLWAFATVTGLSLLISQSGQLFTFITWAGAAYLAWIGVQAIRAGAAGALNVTASRQVSLVQAGQEGLLISLLNPKLAIFFIALFSQFVSADASQADKLILIATATLVDGLWYTLVCLVLSKGSVLSRLQRNSQWINRITGLVLLALAIRVVTL
ncbi:LysE family translocator [Aliamphritea hakodatensis]|uniref:LysE family translocator n=1 Tax=Aliamphritea hakodatensis TaxID=2895352 RepID=UPI0022FD3EA8|nr:LysE family translocator [Aliamphritea hakodatensis]